jgi:hypothetical protein
VDGRRGGQQERVAEKGEIDVMETILSSRSGRISPGS